MTNSMVGVDVAHDVLQERHFDKTQHIAEDVLTTSLFQELLLDWTRATIEKTLLARLFWELPFSVRKEEPEDNALLVFWGNCHTMLSETTSYPALLTRT